MNQLCGFWICSDRLPYFFELTLGDQIRFNVVSNRQLNVGHVVIFLVGTNFFLGFNINLCDCEVKLLLDFASGIINSAISLHHYINKLSHTVFYLLSVCQTNYADKFQPLTLKPSDLDSQLGKDLIFKSVFDCILYDDEVLIEMLLHLYSILSG